MHTVKEQKIFDAGVGQDKYAPARVYKASGQPVPPSTPAHTGRISPKHHGSQTRQTEQIAGWVLPPTKAEIRRMAQQEGISESRVVRDLVEKALQGRIDMQYGSMLKPVIETTIDKKIQSYSNRTANLAVKAYYSAEEARILIIRLLGLLLKDIEELPDLIAHSQKQSRENLQYSKGGD